MKNLESGCSDASRTTESILPLENTAAICPPGCRCPANWTAVTLTHLGTSDLMEVNTLAFDIPSIIPSSAGEFLVFCSIYIGNTGQQGPYQNLAIFTEINNARYYKYLAVYPWNADDYSFASDNMWFPMPTNREVFITVTATCGRHANFNCFVTGYR